MPLLQLSFDKTPVHQTDNATHPPQRSAQDINANDVRISFNTRQCLLSIISSFYIRLLTMNYSA